MTKLGGHTIHDGQLSLVTMQLLDHETLDFKSWIASFSQIEFRLQF